MTFKKFEIDEHHINKVIEWMQSSYTLHSDDLDFPIQYTIDTLAELVSINGEQIEIEVVSTEDEE